MLTNDKALARKARFISMQSQGQSKPATAAVGYNYRMPALNAALGLAQWQHLDESIRRKRQLTGWYQGVLEGESVSLIAEPDNTFSNYWLQTLAFPDQEMRDVFVRETNASGIMTRASWPLLHRHRLFASPYHAELPNAHWAEAHLANIPSTIMPHA